jgi:hypothetical protein
MTPNGQQFTMTTEQRKQQIQLTMTSLTNRLAFLQSEMDNLEKVRSGLGIFIKSLIPPIYEILQHPAIAAHLPAPNNLRLPPTTPVPIFGLETILAGFEGLIDTRLSGLQLEHVHVTKTLEEIQILQKIESSSIIVPRSPLAI